MAGPLGSPSCDPRTAAADATAYDWGATPDSALMWQRVAEAVVAAQPGDVVSVDVSELPDLKPDLVEFLRYADYALSRRGGLFVLDPRSDAVFTQVRVRA